MMNLNGQKKTVSIISNFLNVWFILKAKLVANYIFQNNKHLFQPILIMLIYTCLNNDFKTLKIIIKLS